MATTKKAGKRASGGAKPTRGPKRAMKKADMETAGEPGSKHELVVRLLAQIEESLKEGISKATVADFIRLLQLERELSAEEAKEVVVRWVEPDASPKSEE